ncbi:MAG: enoyl-CoA hydratase/isomerase family protein [Pseudomonadota bacterium]
MPDPEVRFARDGAWGMITLDRPKALNALTLDMVIRMRAQLAQWADDPAVKAVFIEGAGEKAFCAGGDIRWLHDTAKMDPSGPADFFRHEYATNKLVFHFPKPYVALIDGIVMGGGVGVSVHGQFRIVGDRTLFAMPETGIGLIPDVGGGYFLPRLPGGLGFYYGLTGARAKAGDCLATGIATHYVPTAKTDALRTDLLGLAFTGDTDPAGLVKNVLDRHGDTDIDQPIRVQMEEITHYFDGKESVDAIMAALAVGTTDFARDTHALLLRMSPTSLALTFEQLRRGAVLPFDAVMDMEYALVSNIMAGDDFFEGVRALIIDKDKTPRWSPATLAEINRADVQAYFEPVPGPGLT